MQSLSAESGSALVERRCVCPHCWHGFYADHAHYISRHPELFNDPIAGEFENRRFAPHEIQRDREGHVLDPKGWKMVERACPRCHLQIPAELLRKRPIFVSVVGAPSSGKTYFLTSMVHGLRKELPKYFGYALSDSDSHEVKAFLEYERSLFYPSDPTIPTLLKKTLEQGDLYNTVRLDGADITLPKPFIFAFRPTESNIDVARHGSALNRDIVVYDNAGESFEFLKEKDGRNQVTQHLGESDLVLFALDPLQDPNARSRLSAVSQDPQLGKAAATYRQESILSEVIHRIRRHGNVGPNKRLQPVLAICVQKYDVWKPLLAHAKIADSSGNSTELLDHSSVEFDAKLGVGRVDVDEINAISLVVRGFVEDLCPEFVALAETNFKIVRYFPISALGISPEFDDNGRQGIPRSEVLKVRPERIRPFRVTHPFLWMLQREGLVRRVRPQKQMSERTDAVTAVVQSVSDDRIRVHAPTSGRVLVLDKEYAGTVVVDPYSGRLLAIPLIAGAQGNAEKEPIATESIVPKPAQTAQPAPAVPTRAPQLSIEAPIPKKGWFRRG